MYLLYWDWIALKKLYHETYPNKDTKSWKWYIVWALKEELISPKEAKLMDYVVGAEARQNFPQREG